MFLRSTLARCAACLGLAATTAVPAANLIPNANFDSGTSHWQLSVSSGIPSFTVDASQGLPDAPSAHLSSGNPASAISDCVAVTPQYLDLIASARNQGDQASSASVTVQFYSDADCTTAIGSEQLTWTASETAWAQKASYNFYPPNEILSARVWLSVDGLVTIDGHFDSVFFGPTGSAPVALQAFEVD